MPEAEIVRFPSLSRAWAIAINDNRIEVRRRWRTHDAAMSRDPEYEIGKALVAARDRWPRLLGALVAETENECIVSGRYLLPKAPSGKAKDLRTGQWLTDIAVFCAVAQCAPGEVYARAHEVLLKLGFDLAPVELPQAEVIATVTSSEAKTDEELRALFDGDDEPDDFAVVAETNPDPAVVAAAAKPAKAKPNGADAAAPVSSTETKAKDGPLGPEPPLAEPDGVPGEAEAPAFSDEALALLFSARHADTLRHIAAWGRWHEWTGTQWKHDETLHTFDRARALCRDVSTLANKGAKVIASARTVAAVVTLARADRRHAATVDQWDADPWLLNTPGGVVDLRTGDLRPHRREDYCTKQTAVTPGGSCPLWHEFLKTIFAGDDDLIGFMQRICGYILTGSIEEHALFFGHGTGANGKGRFVAAISGMMADYATTAPMETFIVSMGDRHPTELAGLRGARLVTSQETEQGRPWAESKLKQMTGGDRLSARFMRQDFFEFTPQFKLLIMGNNKPSLRTVDDAIRRRMNLIPFNVTIPEEKRDPKLDEKLRAEWPGILAWAIDGCLNWQTDGLRTPEAVRKATDEYLTAEDSVGEWLAACCDRSNPQAQTGVTLLYNSWKTWADAAGEKVKSMKAFSQGLEDRKPRFVKKRGSQGRMVFEGVTLKALEMPPTRNDDR